VAVALAGELVGSTEFIFLGHALRFSLQPRPQAGAYLHSSTSQLHLSALSGIGGAHRDCAAQVEGVVGGVSGCAGCAFVTETAHVELRSGRV
jgi:hypothetical protein